MRTGEIAVVAPFRYSIMLWAILAGYLVWQERPDLPSWIGIAIVTAAGLYTFLREQRLARADPNMTDNLRGIVAVLVSSVAFVLNDVVRQAGVGRAALRRDHRRPRRPGDGHAGGRRGGNGRRAPALPSCSRR